MPIYEREPDDDERREAWEQRRANFHGCKCGHPDMPGQCPGWRNCPMHGDPEAGFEE
jgi:hypothetical protein